MRYDFFVRHLLGVEPPDRNRVAVGDAADDAGPVGAIDFPAEPGLEPGFFERPDPAPPFMWW